MTDKGPSGEDPNKKEEPKIYLDRDYQVPIPDSIAGHEIDKGRFQFSNSSTWPPQFRTEKGRKEVYKVLAKLRVKKWREDKEGKDVADELTMHTDGEQPQPPTDRPVDEKGRAHKVEDKGRIVPGPGLVQPKTYRECESNAGPIIGERVIKSDDSAGPWPTHAIKNQQPSPEYVEIIGRLERVETLLGRIEKGLAPMLSK